MIIGAMPAVIFAEESAETRGGAKLGAERGDIVYYAGKEGETPISWRIIDAEKTNTDDKSGMLLLSENKSFSAEQSLSSITGLKDKYKEFYDEYFSDLYKSAVMTVSKTDESYVRNNETYEGKLENDTIFALSAEEAEKLTTAERAFNLSMWWLRSVKIGKGWISFPVSRLDKTSFMHVQQNGIMNSSEVNNPTNVTLRPAVNIDKTKAANLNGSLLLLPAGEFSAANEALASVGAASEWKLSVKNDDVKIEEAYSTDNERLYMVNLVVKTNLAKVSDNDYISVIIQKKDGSISKYGRYKLDRVSTKIPIMLTDVDRNNDSMYVFYEDYKGAFSGSLSEPVKICIKHDFEYKIDESDNTKHILSCKNCSYTGSGTHSYEKYQSDDVRHTSTCVCGYVINEEHKYNASLSGTVTDFICSLCKRHTFRALAGEFEKSAAVLREDEVDMDSLSMVSGTNYGTLQKVFMKNDNLSCSFEYPKSGITFKTKHDVKATGFQVKTSYLPEKTPQIMTLYGRNSESEEYKKIGAAAFNNLLSAENQEYSFLFADKTTFAPYNDYLIEMETDSESRMELAFFGLLSDLGTVLTCNANGVLIKDAPPCVYPGADSSFVILSKNGHPKKEEISVTADGEPLSGEKWSYSEDSGILTLLGEYIENSVESYNVTAECSDNEIKVELELTALEFDGAKTLKFGEDYSGTFKDSLGGSTFIPKMSGIKVLCDETDISEHCSFENGRLNVPAEYMQGSVLKIIAKEEGFNNPEDSIIQIERPGQNTRFYTDFESAKKDMARSGDMTVKFIGKDDDFNFYQGQRFEFADGKVTIDLNGKKINYSAPSPLAIVGKADITLKNGSLSGLYSVACTTQSDLCSLSVYNVSMPKNGISVYGGRLVVDNNSGEVINNMFVSGNGKFEMRGGDILTLVLNGSPEFKISSGKIGAFRYSDGSKINYSDFLAEGSEFYDIIDADKFAAGESTGFSVRCLHENIDAETGKCAVCGKQFLIKIINGETAEFCDDIDFAISYANENPGTTIRLLADVQHNQKTAAEFKGENTVLDLNGKNLTLDGFSLIRVYAALKITGNGILDSALEAGESENDNPLVTIESGEFKKSVSGKLLLNGGKFVYIASGNVQSLLGKNKVYQNADGTFNMAETKYIANVTVTDAPFIITKQPKGKIISDIAAGEIISVELNAISEYKDKITYQWFECFAVYDGANDKLCYEEKALEGCTSDELQLPTDLSEGDRKIYKCVVSCSGYLVSTDYAVYTFGNRNPSLEYESEDEIIRANGYGRDCVLAVAAYQKGRLLDIKTRSIKAEYGMFTTQTFLGVEQYGADLIKIFLWDSLDNMIPFAEHIEIKRSTISVWSDGEYFAAYSEGTDCVVVIAGYNGDKLISSKAIALNEENDYTCEDTFEKMGLATENSTEIRYFVWDSLERMVPLDFDFSEEVL